MVDQAKLIELWKQVDQGLRRLPGTTRALWEASAAAVPLTVEDDVLILGFEPKDMRHASYLETRVNKSQVLQVVQAKTGKRLDLRCIEGATIDAWERAKEREQQRIKATADALAERQAHKASTEGWAKLTNDLQVLFTGMAARRHATAQAQLLLKALPMVYSTEMAARTTDPDNESEHVMGLNRAFDRIATVCDLPATQVALEYMRYANSRKQKQ